MDAINTSEVIDVENITVFEANRSSTIDVHINPVVKVIALFTCSWIVIAHCAIVYCFIVNRSKPWTNYSKQILSLSSNDLLLGIICLLLLVESSSELKLNYIACSLTFFFFFATVCASLYHVLAICIYRALVLIRKPTTTTPTTVKLSVFLVAFAWMASICICAIPYIVWGKQRQYMPSCQIDFLFGNHESVAVGFLAVWYILPMIFTNIVYTFTCCRLLLIWRKLFRTIAAEPGTTTTHNTFLHSSRAGVQVQRKTIGTIGLLLLCFNLFTLPLIIMMCAEYYDKTVPRSVRTLVSLVFVMNCAISPFVYAIRTKFLRSAMKDLIKDCMSFLFCKI